MEEDFRLRLVRSLKVGLLGLLVSLSGCVRSLREPPSLEELAGSTRAAGEVEDLMSLAEARFARRSPESVREAAELWTQVALAAPDRLEGLVGAVRARVWLTEHEADPEVRRLESIKAVQTAQWCGIRARGEPLCAYWLGAALGVQARERRATALDALTRIAELFERAARADPALEEAGPDRALALLYVRAPGWPTGPGDPDLGLEHARKAVGLRPEFPPNQMALGEALDETGDREGGRKAYERALELARARGALGDPDAPEWADAAREALGRLQERR